MKTRFIIAFVALFAFSVKAQELRSGIKAGANISTLNGAGSKEYEFRLGIHFGAFLEVPISRNFYLQPEILYSAQGINAEYSSLIMVDYSVVRLNRKVKLPLHYLNVPIMAKIYLSKNFALETGPQTGFLISAKRNNEISINSGLSEEKVRAIKAEYEDGETNVKDYFKTVELGLAFGASYQLDMGILVGARYIFGLTNVYKTEANPTQENSVLQFSVGYSF